MNITSRGWTLAVALLAGAGPAAGSEEIAIPLTNTTLSDYRSCTLYTENDVYVVGSGTDRYYTTGQKVTVITTELAGFEEAFRQRWMKFLARKATEKAEQNTAVRQRPARSPNAAPAVVARGTQYRVATTFGHNIYTPADITTSRLIPEDRPYAGWLYLGVALQARSTDEGPIARLSVWHVDVGVVGPGALGQQVQDFVHDNISESARAEGWAHQLHNEPGLNLVYQHKVRWFPTRVRDNWGFDAVGHGGFSLGNVATFANAGLGLRVGYGLPDDFGDDPIRPGSDSSQVGGTDPKWGAHVFAGCDVRAVARDIFLDGNTFRASHRVDRENTVIDFHFGIAVNHERWKLTLTQVLRTPEFKNQNQAQAYGSVTLTFPLGRRY